MVNDERCRDGALKWQIRKSSTRRKIQTAANDGERVESVEGVEWDAGHTSIRCRMRHDAFANFVSIKGSRLFSVVSFLTSEKPALEGVGDCSSS